MKAQLQGLEPMQVALNGLIKKIWIENAIQDARHHKLGLERRQGIVGIIQVVGQPNTQFGSNAERGIQNKTSIYYVQAIYHWKDN